AFPCGRRRLQALRGCPRARVDRSVAPDVRSGARGKSAVRDQRSQPPSIAGFDATATTTAWRAPRTWRARMGLRAIGPVAADRADEPGHVSWLLIAARRKRIPGVRGWSGVRGNREASHRRARRSRARDPARAVRSQASGVAAARAHETNRLRARI